MSTARIRGARLSFAMIRAGGEHHNWLYQLLEDNGRDMSVLINLMKILLTQEYRNVTLNDGREWTMPPASLIKEWK